VDTVAGMGCPVAVDAYDAALAAEVTSHCHVSHPAVHLYAGAAGETAGHCAPGLPDCHWCTKFLLCWHCSHSWGLYWLFHWSFRQPR
jgi:hypothetical protein